MLVGAYYFPGWCREQRWYCIAANRHVQHPLLGYYREGDPLAADWHIKWALEHGVSFFAFDYYLEDGGEMLETALADGFLKSRFIDRFRFCLNWCNHAPYETQDRAQWDHFVDLTVGKYIQHPSYLRLNGKAVVMVLAGYSFVKTLGVEGAKEAFGELDRRCREVGHDGVSLVFCEGGIMSEQAVADCLAAGAHGFCLYNFPYAGTGFTGPGEPYAEAPYADLIPQGEGLWKHWKGITQGAFWPTVMAGWDRRPWTKDRDLVRTGFTPELFGEALRRAREHVNADRVVMIEAWNEWGEGSILEPSRESGFAYLRQVHGAFCPGAEPPAEGAERPPFPQELQLPSLTAFTFDFDNQGWTGARCTELLNRQGVLVTTSTSGDPALTGPPNYVACADFRSLRVRMRLTPAPGTPAGDTCTAQVFWSTVERQMCEELSVVFSAKLDGQWHEYTLDLTAKPTWTGMADLLRLDPTDRAEVRIEVDRIELL